MGSVHLKTKQCMYTQPLTFSWLNIYLQKLLENNWGARPPGGINTWGHIRFCSYLKPFPDGRRAQRLISNLLDQRVDFPHSCLSTWLQQAVLIYPLTCRFLASCFGCVNNHVTNVNKHKYSLDVLSQPPASFLTLNLSQKWGCEQQLTK